MKIYVNIIWAAIGLVIALYGLGIWKGKFKHLAEKINPENTSEFSEYFGKTVIFLGAASVASSVICINSPNYISVSILLNVLSLVYFVLECVHLKRKYR